MACIGGEAQVVRLANQLTQASIGAAVTIATDSPAIEWYVTNAGHRAVLTDEARNGTERVALAAKQLGLKDSDVVLNVQADILLRDVSFFTELAAKISVAQASWKFGWASFGLAENESASAHFSSVWATVEKSDSHAIDFDRSLTRSISAAQVRLAHMGVYLYRVSVLSQYLNLKPSRFELERSLEQMRLVEAGMTPLIVELATLPNELNTEADYIDFQRSLVGKDDTHG